MTIKTINPATGKVLSTYKETSNKEIDKIIAATHKAFLTWRAKTFAERSHCMQKAAEILLDNKIEYARLMAQEMGKPIKEGVAEVEKCAWNCRYYAEHAESYLKPYPIEAGFSKSYVTYNPLGIVLAIMPWNFPFWQVFRFAAPTLMAGNAALLKHASSVTGCGLAVEEVFRLAGFPINLFRTLVVSGEKIDKIIDHRDIAAVTLTGSDQTGRVVGSQAGAVIKKVVLELGGSDPYLILEDADLNQAADAVVASRMNNAGQSCIAAKRIIVIQSIQKEFEKLILTKLTRYHYGDPLNFETLLGPLAREDLRAQVHKQVQASIRKGARCLLGGKLPKESGFYYPATVLTQVKKGMPAFDEEIFGPVVSIISAKNEEQAIQLANDSEFGLGSAVFTRDINRGEKIAAEKIQAGSCFVNDFVRSDPRLPFGGIRHSGFGRELSGEGIREFVNIKTVAIKSS